MRLVYVEDDKYHKLIETLEAALSTCGEWGLTTEQEELFKEHLEDLRAAKVV
jgi:hypothetical protein